MNAKNKFMILTAVVSMVFLAPGLSYAADQAELLAQKKAELNGHEWQVKVVPAANPKGGDSSEDTLIFKDMKFESTKMTAKGFPSTNYTITLQEGGPSVFETMQSDDKGAVINWRGEWEGERMNGVMSKQSEGKSEDFYFSSLSSKAIVEPPKVEVPAVPAEAEAAADAATGVPAAAAEAVEQVNEEVKAAEVPAAETPAPEAPKKKKGWF